MDTKEKIAIMQAYMEGESIEYRDSVNNGPWALNTGIPLWDWVHKEYRIKRKPVERWAIEDKNGSFHTTFGTRLGAEDINIGMFNGKGRVFLMREVVE